MSTEAYDMSIKAYDRDGVEIEVGYTVYMDADDTEHEVIEVNTHYVRVRQIGSQPHWVFSKRVRVSRDPIKFLEKIPI